MTLWLLLALGAACTAPVQEESPGSIDEPLPEVVSAVVEEPEIEIFVAATWSNPFLGIHLPEIRIDGDDLAYTRITFWVDADGDGLPSRDEIFDVQESRGRGPIVLRNKEFRYRAQLMGEIYVEDSQGRSRSHRWQIRTED